MRERKRERKRERSQDGGRSLLRLRNDIPSLLPYYLVHRDQPLYNVREATKGYECQWVGFWELAAIQFNDTLCSMILTEGSWTPEMVLNQCVRMLLNVSSGARPSAATLTEDTDEKTHRQR